MIVVAATAISIVINGTLVSASRPARIVDGAIAAPLRPIVANLTSGEVVSTSGETVTIEAGDHRIVLQIGSFDATIDGAAVHVPLAPFRDASAVFVPLAPIVRTLGGTIAYDARARSAAIAFERPNAPLATMTPFNPSAPSAAPTTVFTPSPAPTVRPTEEPDPHPRRTAIPASPSYPPP